MEASEKSSVLRGKEKVTAKDVFDAYKEQDELAGEIVEKFSRYLGHALAIFASVSDPDVIVIGGGVSKAGEVLVECVQKQYENLHFPHVRKHLLNWQPLEMMQVFAVQQN